MNREERAKNRANTWYDVKVLLREIDNLLTKPIVWAVVILPAAVLAMTGLYLLVQVLS